MAPKTAKRAAQATKVSPVAKAAKVSVQPKAGDPKEAGVVEAIELAKDLSEPVKAMLLAMVHGAFDTPANERHEAQAAAVRMVGQVMDDVRAKLQQEFKDEEAAASAADAKKADLAQASKEAADHVQAAKDVVEAKKVTLAEASKATVTCKAALAKSQVAQDAVTASQEKDKSEKVTFEEAFEKHFKVLRDETLDANAASMHYSSILPLLLKLGLDESLLTALPSSTSKAPGLRGTFDNMVIAQLEASFQECLTKLSSSVENSTSIAAEHAAAVQAAEREFEEAKAAQQNAASDLNAAQGKSHEAVAALKAAEDAVAKFEFEYKNATKVRDACAAALKRFEDWNVSCFVQLRDFSSKKEAPIEEAPAPKEILEAHGAAATGVGGA